jgi:hypothetical protein
MQCAACGGAGTILKDGKTAQCTICAGTWTFADGSKLEVSGHDHDEVKSVLRSVLPEARGAKRFAKLGFFAGILAAAIGVFANLAAIAQFLGLEK